MTLEERMNALERQSGFWRFVCLLQAAVLLGVLGFFVARPHTTAQASDGILRAKGLILTDTNGRARILMGAPLPETKDRIRQDFGYESMLFLDEQGHDRISLGQGLPPQVDGTLPKDRHRLASGYGYLINDSKGNERGGFGFSDNGRAIIALDRPEQEGWAAIVDDKTGFAGTTTFYDRSFGENNTGVFSGTQGKKAFLDLKDSMDRPREQLQVGPDGTPTISILDQDGKVVKNLVGH